MLYHDFLTNEKNPLYKERPYFVAYEKHFGKFVNQSVNFWEIGVFKGGSVQMWKRYLGPFAKIIGIDINPECKRLEDDQITVCIGDQSDPVFLQSIIDKYGPPDAVLDDGSHMMEHVCATFDFLYDKVSKNGVYMVEDLCTAYWDSHGGGLRREGTFIERCKDMIDSLNAYSIKGHPKSFAKSTCSICFYESIAVFEKYERIGDHTKTIMVPDRRKCVLHDKYGCNEISVSELTDSKVILFGAGYMGRNINDALINDKIEVVCIVDNDTAKHNSYVNTTEVTSLEKALEITGGKYVIAMQNAEAQNEVFRQLEAMGIDNDNIYKATLYDE